MEDQLAGLEVRIGNNAFLSFLYWQPTAYLLFPLFDHGSVSSLKPNNYKDCSVFFFCDVQVNSGVIP